MTRRERIAYTSKLVVAYALFYTGLLRLYQSLVLRRRAVVLMYHRVLSSGEREATGSHHGIVVDDRTFAEQMAFLSRRFRVLSLNEFADRLEGRAPFHDSSCLITFDDGWRDNFVNALPVLIQHNLPAVVFLPVNYVGERRLFWQEALTHLLHAVVGEVKKNPRRRERFCALLNPLGLAGVLDLGERVPRSSIREIVSTKKLIDGPPIQKLISALTLELRFEFEGVRRIDGFMTWDEVCQMSRHRVAFGGHGAEHRILTLLSIHEAETEIRTSKEVLDSHLSPRTAAFAYPNGNWNSGVAGEVRKTGFELAFTTEPGFVSCGDDRFALRRVNVHEDMTGNTPMFLARVVGLL